MFPFTVMTADVKPDDHVKQHDLRMFNIDRYLHTYIWIDRLYPALEK